MTDDLDGKLRGMLRPLDPGEDFTAQVLARVGRTPKSPLSPRSQPSRLHSLSRLAWLPAALAASLVLAIVVRHSWQQREEAAGLRARQQVLEALRVTSSKLDLAYQMVNAPSPAPRADSSQL